MKLFGNFRECRQRAGLTQVETAAALNVDQTAISQWENGTTQPRADKLPLLAKLYGCTIDDLFKTDK